MVVVAVAVDVVSSRRWGRLSSSRRRAVAGWAGLGWVVRRWWWVVGVGEGGLVLVFLVSAVIQNPNLA